jgi:tRNA(fMet)-specific endonuclease VapC
MSSLALYDAVVVDTNVISFFIKTKPDTRSRLYESHLISSSLLVIAAQTRAELEFWALSRNWRAERLSKLKQFLEGYVLAEVDEELALKWAAVKHQALLSGHPIDCADAWIAATALVYDVPLITHNPDDFKYVQGLVVITEKEMKPPQAP